MDEFLQDLDEDVEGMQSTIYLLKNELQKCKASMQNTEHKKTNPKTVVNGIKKESVITSETPSVSKLETPKQLVKVQPDIKLSKHDKSKDSKLLHCKSNKHKVKKSHSTLTESTVVQSVKIPKVHKSDGSKSEEKRKKSEKRPQSKSEVVLKKSKSDQSKSTDVIAPETAINGLSNGS